MSRSSLDEAVIDVLSALEYRETELLSWGIVDGGFTRDELHDFVGDFLIDQAYLFDAEEVVEELQQRRVLFRL
jgi:hypothetical protein